jgi:hypothetical protein
MLGEIVGVAMNRLEVSLGPESCTNFERTRGTRR